MAPNIVNPRLVLLVAASFAMLAASTAFAGSDSVLNGGWSNGGSSSGGLAASMQMGVAVGRLTESLTTIFGIYYAFKAVLIYSKIVSGKATGQGDTLGGFFSHLVGGIFAYHSRAFFSMAHNTIPMLPDFGRLVYDAELWRSLMS